MLTIPWSIISYLSSGNFLQWIQKLEFETNHLISAIIALAIFGFILWAALWLTPLNTTEVDASRHTDVKHDEPVDTKVSDREEGQTK